MTRRLHFAVSLYGGRLATVRVPIPLTTKNLERLKRMIGDQLEPFVDNEDVPTPAQRSGREGRSDGA